MPDISGPSDAELITLTRTGRIEVFETLMDRHLPSLIGFFHYLGVPSSLIDDLAQETFFKAFRKLELYDPARPFATWLITIGRNVFLDERRKTARDSRLTRITNENPPPLSVENSVIERVTARELLDALDEGARFLLEMRLFQDLPFSDIAVMTGEPETTLRVRYHRLLNRLRLTASRPGEAHDD
ncbi:MAG: sigma-70 family RNA polymerase sigma factor [Candidatus Riflebacteria bacterium]|nr:sigma-70 family RNA polymerase sigma factor [Candidatus Riflebacteria bacterium]